MATKTKFDAKEVKKAIEAMDYDSAKMDWEGHVDLIVQKANKDKSLAFLERYLAKMKQFQRPKPPAEETKKKD